jgi:hypothetical protein
MHLCFRKTACRLIQTAVCGRAGERMPSNQVLSAVMLMMTAGKSLSGATEARHKKQERNKSRRR